MTLQAAVPLLIIKGKAELPYPIAFKREALSASIQCKSLSFMDNHNAINEPLFIICSGSTYRNEGYNFEKNILGMFQNKTHANTVSFDYSVPITNPQDPITVEIVDLHGKRQEINEVAVFYINRLVKNQLLAM